MQVRHGGARRFDSQAIAQESAWFNISLQLGAL